MKAALFITTWMLCLLASHGRETTPSTTLSETRNKDSSDASLKLTRTLDTRHLSDTRHRSDEELQDLMERATGRYVAPTLLAMLKLAQPNEMTGQSLGLGLGLETSSAQA